MSSGNLDIGSNGFTGTLPEEIFALTNLLSFNLSDTRVSGELSENIGDISKLIDFYVGSTNMSGTLPSQLFSLNQLRKLDLGFASFTGSLSESFLMLTNLDFAKLDHNGFKGTIPPGFENLPFLGMFVRGESMTSTNIDPVVLILLDVLFLSLLVFRKSRAARQRPKWFGAQRIVRSPRGWIYGTSGSYGGLSRRRSRGVVYMLFELPLTRETFCDCLEWEWNDDPKVYKQQITIFLLISFIKRCEYFRQLYSNTRCFALRSIRWIHRRSTCALV